MDPSGKHKKTSRCNCANKENQTFFCRELPAIVALSQPCSKLPIDAAMATNTAPPMAAKIYACTAATTALIISSSLIGIPNPAILEQKETKQRTNRTQKEPAYTNKPTRDSRGGVLSLTLLRRPRFVIPDWALGLLKQQRWWQGRIWRADEVARRDYVRR